jgi:uncharacterized Zn ribbon protein
MANNMIPASLVCGMKKTYPDGDHDIDCKVDGQSMLLKPEFMKKYEK